MLTLCNLLLNNISIIKKVTRITIKHAKARFKRIKTSTNW